MASVVYCNGNITQGLNGTPRCADGWELMDVSNVSSLTGFDISVLDPTVLAQMYSIGFVLVGSVWLIGWAGREILAMIRR